MQKKFAFIFILTSLGTYALLSILSFYPADPSEFSASFPTIAPENLGGKVGAQIAAFLFFNYGIVSTLFPLSLFYFALLLALNRPLNLASRLISILSIYTSLVMLLPLVDPQIRWKGIDYYISGKWGQIGAHWLNLQFGTTGTVLVFVTLILTFTIPWQEATSLIKLLWQRTPKWQFYRNLKPTLEEESRLQKLPNKFSQKPQTPISTKNSSIKPILDCDNSIIRPEADHYQAPTKAHFFGKGEKELSEQEIARFKKTADQLVKAFENFNISGDVTGFTPGPTVTVFEYKPSAGTKLSKLTSLMDDVAMALKVDSIFIHPISGKNLVGIQVPNMKPETVLFGDLLQSQNFSQADSPLTFAIGKNLKGEPVCEPLDQMPHLLMAGQTGSGKSVAINSLICSILMKSSPQNVKFILVDPKILELKMYEGIPHLLMPVITEPEKASAALKWATQEMDRRYKLMEMAQVRNISGFNDFWQQLSPGQKEHFCEDLHSVDVTDPLPYIVLVIDELADLMLTAPKDVEASIQRLAQKARASGIHLVLATQRPSVDVITGVIKANLPSRIAFKVFSRGDSRTILDSVGAEKLLGRGDMLYLKPGKSRLERMQGAFLSDEEVRSFVAEMKGGNPQYDQDLMDWIERETRSSDLPAQSDDDTLDPKWDEAISIAQSNGQISASYLQRQLKIGYNRAARVIEAMELQNLIAKADGVKPRKWLGSSHNI